MESEERFWLSVRPGKWWPAALLMLLSGEVMKDVEGETPVGEDVCGMAKKDVRRRWRESRVEVVGWEGEKGDGLVVLEAILSLMVGSLAWSVGSWRWLGWEWGSSCSCRG
jgi:hypothetical protein